MAAEAGSVTIKQGPRRRFKFLVQYIAPEGMRLLSTNAETDDPPSHLLKRFQGGCWPHTCFAISDNSSNLVKSLSCELFACLTGARKKENRQ